MNNWKERIKNLRTIRDLQISELEVVRQAYPGRTEKNLERRLLKLGEELGELMEAYLYVTSETNTKNKSWQDVMEEACDVALIAFDIALTQPDTFKHEGDEVHFQKVREMFLKKILKWEKSLEYNEEITRQTPSGSVFDTESK